MELYLAHHGLAVDAHEDMRRPLAQAGRQAVARLAAAAAERQVTPDVFWHSGKLRAKQTAEIYWRACNPLAPLEATRDLQPEDPPTWMADRLRYEPRRILIAGHFPHLPRLLALLVGGAPDAVAAFPVHGLVALETTNEGKTWSERWRLEAVLDRDGARAVATVRPSP